MGVPWREGSAVGPDIVNSDEVKKLTHLDLNLEIAI